jgi:sec-independent protein translocase protein TatA
MIGDLFDSPWKILIIAIVIIVLFGSRKLPVAARSLGQSMRILKKEVSALHEDEPAPSTSTSTGTNTTVQAAPAQLQAPAEPAASSTNPQAQIDALSKQLADLQQSVKTTDGAQAK